MKYYILCVDAIIQQHSCISSMVSVCQCQECLTIFGSGSGPGSTATSLKMCYAGYGRPLVVMLEEDGVLTDCSLKTLEPDEVLDFDFCSTNVINKIIMKVDMLLKPTVAWMIESIVPML